MLERKLTELQAEVRAVLNALENQPLGYAAMVQAAKLRAAVIKSDRS